MQFNRLFHQRGAASEQALLHVSVKHGCETTIVVISLSLLFNVRKMINNSSL